MNRDAFISSRSGCSHRYCYRILYAQGNEEHCPISFRNATRSHIVTVPHLKDGKEQVDLIFHDNVTLKEAHFGKIRCPVQGCTCAEGTIELNPRNISSMFKEKR